MADQLRSSGPVFWLCPQYLLDETLVSWACYSFECVYALICQPLQLIVAFGLEGMSALCNRVHYDSI